MPRAVSARVRPAMLIAGTGLALMAVLSPFGFLLALPAGDTVTAGVVGLLVAVLDVVVALALVPVLTPGGRRLCIGAAALRIAYALVLGVAAGALLVTGDGEAFQRRWDAGLLLFGAHLALAGWAAIRARGIPTWIGALVALAGAGYLVDSAGALLAPDVGLSIGAFTFVGEVVLLVWLLWRGFRPSRTAATRWW